MHPFQRTELLVGRSDWEELQGARILVVGVGGVGSFAAEAVARAGVGRIGLVDFDQVCITNLNRQLHAMRRTVGASKVALMAERARNINPRAEVVVEQAFFSAENADRILALGWDHVLDCIDNVTAKLVLLEACVRHGLPVVSAMGAGGRLDPTRVRVTALDRTEKDPLARVVRNTLRARGVSGPIEAVWTDEEPATLDAGVAEDFSCVCPNGDNGMHSCEDRNVVQGSVSWMPAIFGMMMAGTAINRLLGRPVLSSDRASRPGIHKRRAARRAARG